MSKRPNFLIIVADDLGFSDLGCYGSEINTPNLDKLAQGGVRMTDFHTAAACSPTRSMLFSGTDNHIAGLGEMVEYMVSFKEYFQDKPGYEGYLNWRVAALPEILQDSGYHTIFSGKWHLGLTKEFAPSSRGFTKDFTFLPGAGNHFGYEPQLQDDVYFPALTSKGHWMEDGAFFDHEDLPEDFYSTATFTDKMLDKFKLRTEEERQKPFFATLAFTAPHWPLQAPKHVVDKYRGKYDQGPDHLAASRLRRLIDLGLVSKTAQIPDPVGVQGYEWSTMTADARARSARAMEVYAAMVEIVDDNVGRVLKYLEETGELDNTFVLFMSDNGAEGASIEAAPIMGGTKTMAYIFDKYYNNSLENIGRPDSFVWYGPRWACASTAPSRGMKSWVLEGGIRCPCIVSYPQWPTNPGAITDSFTSVMDILPTILELAGVPHPGKTFRGREVVLPQGKSWVNHLSSSSDARVSVYDGQVDIHGWEFLNHKAIRKGNWKAVWISAPRGKDEWELYDIEKDPSELSDLATERPDILEEMIFHWEQYYSETGMIPTPMLGHRP
ncbi:hypothetical protein CDV36_003478 [Fusarium kuroshium]|uniref:Sulfatase N-terminal domain-containing protein n=1 Tax=Fusarium kuroshium TaxID=2010991 RepID=A0A3M2SH04_9HYPO|nr:hypothetical protein CDV36_003478 [Fusarium kuroshium]